MKIEACAFDIDGTLTQSKARLSSDVAVQICELLQKYPVALITGGTYRQIQDQIIEILVKFNTAFPNLHILPLSGAEYYLWNDVKHWHVVHRHEIPLLERQKIIKIIYQTAKELGLWIENTWGDSIEDRICQVTFSAWGQDAPVEIKRQWDPNGNKKLMLCNNLQSQLPQYSVRSGGLTSVDINLGSINKGVGLLSFADRLNIVPQRIVFVGDQLEYGGNDYPILATGACCIPVQSVENTVRVIDSILGKGQQ